MRTNPVRPKISETSDQANLQRRKRPSVSPPVMLYRVGNLLHRAKIPALPKVISIVNRLVFSCVIPSTASIGSDFTLGYWGLGVVLHSKSIIGNRCLVSQNVTVGRKAGLPGVPQLGDNVAVGAGAVIVGGITLGDNCVVGAGSVVTRSFPAGSVIAGVPARLLRQLDADESHSHYLER